MLTQGIARLASDFRFALRFLLRRPGLTLPSIASLALAIGATTAIYSLVHAVFLRPIPVEEPERLVGIHGGSANPARAGRFLPTSLPNIRDYAAQARNLDDVLAFARTQLSLSGSGEAERVYARLTTANYFAVLGVRPRLGQGFEGQEEGAAVAVLSDPLWRRHFAADPGVIGRKIELDGHPFTVIGVAPEGFRGASTMGSPELWVPLWTHPQIYTFSQYVELRGAKLFDIIGRLAPGSTVQEARAELETIGINLEQAYPEDNKDHRVKVRAITESAFNPNMRDRYSRAGTVLLVAVGLVLLIACANVANLQLAQATVRRKEIALRLSLGASRGSLIRQLLTESLVVALLSGTIGVVLAIWGQKLIWSFRPAFMSVNTLDLRLDAGVLVVSLLVTLGAGVLFGLVPALQASKPNLVGVLKDGEDAALPRQRFSLRKVIVVAQVALSLLALTGAGLFLRSLHKMQEIDTGYATENLFLMTFHLGTQRYDENRGLQYYERLLENVRGMPEVVEATLIENPPFDPGSGLLQQVSAEGADPGTRPLLVRASGIASRYFETLGLPLVRGRAFSERDRSEAPPVAIVNETLARMLWPNHNALGARFHFGDGEMVEIVGVAQDSKYLSMIEDSTPYLYLPSAQSYTARMTLEARLRSEAGVESIRRLAHGFDADVPITDIDTVDGMITTSLWLPRMGAGLLSIFGVLALVLSIVGLYGVITNAVNQRIKEIGIRMSLGAERRTIMGLVLRQSLTIISVGVVIGLALAMAGHRLLRSQLYEAETLDPVALMAVTSLLVAVAILATLVPALRATRIDPTRILRQE